MGSSLGGIVIIILILSSALKIVPEYQRLVVFRLYLADALGAIDAPYVHFSFTVAGKPCLVQGISQIDADPSSDYKHVIMLMRLPN